MITNNIVTKDGEVGIYAMSITYMQNADCCSDSDEFQHITLEMRNGGTKPSETFVNIRTGESGWSTDNGECIKAIVDDFMNRYNVKNEN